MPIRTGTIPCHVIAIIPTADRQRATVEVRVGFDELDSRILPDMGVKVAFQEEGGTGTPGQAGVLVPQSAISERGGKKYVLLLVNGLVERRAIALAGERGKEMLVTSGLSGGDIVILNAPSNLETGIRVKEKS